MPFRKKKVQKSISPQLEYLRKQREKEWADILGKKLGKHGDREYKKEFEKLKEKYGDKTK